MTGPAGPSCCGGWPLRLREPAPASLLSFLLGFLLAFSRRPWPPFRLFCPATPTAGRVSLGHAAPSKEALGMAEGPGRGCEEARQGRQGGGMGTLP